MPISEKLTFGFSKKLPLVLQTEAAECGLACLVMIFRYHGYECDLPTLRRKYSISLKGAPLKQIIEIAGKLQFNARPLRVEVEALGRLSLPCMLHWDLNHYLVLKQVGRDSVVIHDPGYGERKLSLEEVSEHFTGIAVEFSPAPGFRRKKDTQEFSWGQLVGRTSGLKRSLLQVLVLAGALEVLVVLGPLLNQLVFDHVLVTADTDLLTVVVVGMVTLALIQLAVNVLRGWAVMVMSASLNIQWLANAFAHLMRLPISWFEKRHLGDITSRFNAVHVIQGALTTRFIEALLDGLLSVGALAMMFVYNARLGFIVVGLVSMHTLVRFATYSSSRRMWEAEIVFGAKQHTVFLESLRSVRTLRLFNATEQRNSQWLNHLIDERNASLKRQRLGLFTELSLGTMFYGLNVAILGLGARDVVDNRWSIGMLLAFISYNQQFAGRAAQLIEKCMEFKMLGLQGDRLADIVLTEPEAEHPVSVDPTPLSPSIKVDGLRFRYGDGEAWVVDGCSFEVGAGESVALVGASGCGKTTLMKLMLGLVDPDEGTIYYGGQSIRQIGTREYRDLIGVVMQDDQLLSGSIADNISFFAPDADLKWVEECARLAAVHEDITRMPMRYHTLTGDFGTTLSGGQKQRVILARALYKRPKVLFLDEATSHLDVANELSVNEAIRKLGTTTVIVAHRPETIRMADRVIAIEEGRAVEVNGAAYLASVGAAA